MKQHTIEAAAPPPKGSDGPTLQGSATIDWGETPEETVKLLNPLFV